MLLSITTTHQPATDLGYLLGKHPERLQTFELAYGNAHVFYPVANAERCTACLLLDIDPIGLVRNHRGRPDDETLARYVNDRPYVASSFMSVAIARVFTGSVRTSSRSCSSTGRDGSRLTQRGKRSCAATSSISAD